MVFKRVYDMDVLYRAIYVAFEGDEELFSRYHIKAGEHQSDCILDTFEKIRDASENLPLEHYIVTVGRIVIGYCVTSEKLNMLYSFGIAIDYREEYSDLFFEEVKNHLGENFFCALWTRNRRGIKYLVRNGMRIIDEIDNVTTLCL